MHIICLFTSGYFSFYDKYKHIYYDDDDYNTWHDTCCRTSGRSVTTIYPDHAGPGGVRAHLVGPRSHM